MLMILLPYYMHLGRADALRVAGILSGATLALTVVIGEGMLFAMYWYLRSRAKTASGPL